MRTKKIVRLGMAQSLAGFVGGGQPSSLFSEIGWDHGDHQVHGR